jgi:beta-phosphoglucomutase-like phosphatase (HAD superfamily)
MLFSLPKNLVWVSFPYFALNFFWGYIGKPNPDMYLELVRRLNLDKNHCIIFEDSISGVRAAVAAQIKCIGMLTSAKKETLEQYGTWRTINNFDEVDFDEIWNILQEKKSFL